MEAKKSYKDHKKHRILETFKWTITEIQKQRKKYLELQNYIDNVKENCNQNRNVETVRILLKSRQIWKEM